MTELAVSVCLDALWLPTSTPSSWHRAAKTTRVRPSRFDGRDLAVGGNDPADSVGDSALADMVYRLDVETCCTAWRD